MTTALVILSGGLDSTVAATLATREHGPGNARALTFDYGQRHAAEITRAAQVAADLGIGHQVVSIAGLLSGSALLGAAPVPHGRYDAPSMSATVVPGRNLLFAAAAVAQAEPGEHVWFGVHAGDHPIYPDCRPEFWQRLGALTADAYQVHLRTPFLRSSKAEVVRQGYLADAPMHLSWSCYEGGDVHCGRCGTCVERAEAFDLAVVEDPTEYADPVYWREAVGTLP